MDFWSSLQGWQASTFGLWRATWLGTFMQIPGQRHTWQEPVFFSPGARPSFYGRFNGECYDHGVVENSSFHSEEMPMGQSSRSRKHSSRPNLSEPWFFWARGVPYFDLLAANVAWTLEADSVQDLPKAGRLDWRLGNIEGCGCNGEHCFVINNDKFGVSICTLLLTNSTDFILSTLGFTY